MLRALVLLLLFSAPVAAQEFFTLKGHGGPVMDVAVSPSGQIATASFDNAVGLWSEGAPTWLDGHAAAVNAVSFLSERWLASAGDDFSLRLWDVNTDQGRIVGEHRGKVAGIAFSPDGETIATASWDGSIGVWLMAGLGDRPLADVAVIGRMLEGHKSGVNAVAFSSNGKTIYSASSDGTVRSWRFDDAGVVSNVLVKHGFGINKLILNDADGWLAYGAVDGGTRMIDLKTGEQIADFTLERRPILALAYHAPSGQLAVGDGEGYIMVVDTVQKRIVKDFKAARNGPIWALAFSPNGQNIHASGIEDILYSWPIATMTEHGQMATSTRSFLENPETLPNGERQFKRKCSICHALTPGSARKAGPTLHGVFGRRAGTVTDYSYSPTLTGSDIVWDETTIDLLFDLGPDHYIPGSKMPMQRITKPEDRKDLVAFLRQATQPAGTQGEN